MIRPAIAGFASVCLFVGAVASQEAQNPQQKDSQQPDQAERAAKIGQQDDADQNARDAQQRAEQTQPVELPESLTALDLTEQQKQELLTIYRENDQQSQQLWAKVQDLHRQAISMEAAVIAAARLEGHDHSAHGQNDSQAARNAQPAGANAATRDNQNTTADAKTVNESKLVTEDARPDGDAENRNNRKNRRADGTNATANDRRQKRADRQSLRAENNTELELNGLDGELDIVAIRVAVAEPNGRVREHLLTQAGDTDVSENSDKNSAFQKCQRELTQIWKEIHDGHEELVELEASTIVKVEAQLTEAQLEKLDATSNQASTTPTNPTEDTRR
jgi:hypothetical protein